MSQTTNTNLFERAVECIDYFEGKMPATLIEEAIERDDLDLLAQYVASAEAEMSRQEYYTYDNL